MLIFLKMYVYTNIRHHPMITDNQTKHLFYPKKNMETFIADKTENLKL